MSVILPIRGPASLQLTETGLLFFYVLQAGFSALHLAAQNGHNESSRILLFAGCSPDCRNSVSYVFNSCISRLWGAGGCMAAKKVLLVVTIDGTSPDIVG